MNAGINNLASDGNKWIYQWHLKWSKGSLQSLHWYNALQAVLPNWLNSLVLADWHCGQITGAPSTVE